MFRRLLCLSLALGLITGCSASVAPQPMDADQAGEATAQAFLDEWNNRKIYDRLDEETLTSISDDDLEQAISDYTWSKVTEAEDFHQALLNLPDGLAAFYYLDELQGEVDNGGYNQYFFNTNGDHVESTRWALNLLGFKKLTDNYEKAVSIWTKEKNDPQLQALYESGTLEDFSESYKHTDLNQCDDEFYALSEEIGAAKIEFVRANPTLFVDD